MHYFICGWLYLFDIQDLRQIQHTESQFVPRTLKLPTLMKRGASRWKSCQHTPSSKHFQKVTYTFENIERQVSRNSEVFLMVFLRVCRMSA